jgi:predicted house-cleaning noncanonical NTP pyrophosphatase (MazG superfamily)
VRDKMISIIQAKGEPVSFHIADKEEYKIKLKEKLLEEVHEFIEAENKEEMADVFEVITAILPVYGFTLEEIIEVQKNKREERGAFDQKIILEES